MAIASRAPQLGEHNIEVFAELETARIPTNRLPTDN